VLIDEPESHLHPPLLSAFIRALSDLLLDRNGLSIIATHSPVVLQEVPKRCVWKINRSRLSTESRRPDIETFGENVGILTREVFGLEVVKSGFHDLLVQSV
ncbi:AAA family ATPase, partial [Escherichia coli]|nr:AAA family ATPase [Escherichia coli]